LIGSRFYIENLGCAKNQVDAEVMMAALERRGWQSAEPEESDVIIINSCGFIAPAKEESINVTLSTLEEYPGARVVMAGCLSQRYAEDIAGEIPELAGVFGNRAPHLMPEFLSRVQAGDKQATGKEAAVRHEPLVWLPTEPLTTHPRQRLLSFPGSAFVKVSEGCDNRCTFCAIPLIRGKLRSKPLPHLLNEIDELLSKGTHEINLVAQDFASYGRDFDRPAADRGATTGTNGGANTPGMELLRALSAREGDFWIRLLYVYPERFPTEFLDVIEADPRLLPYFDIPFQHAAPSVLKKMGRPGTAEGYLRLIDEIRGRLPDVFIRSTLLTGFFGEDEAAFAELLAFQEAAQLDWLGVFPYSPEEGTPAMRGEPDFDVGPELAIERANELNERQRPITEGRVDRLVGKKLPVLVEELLPEEPLALGRCYAQAPEVDGAVVLHIPDDRPEIAIAPGQLVECAIIRRNGLDVEAVPL